MPPNKIVSYSDNQTELHLTDIRPVSLFQQFVEPDGHNTYGMSVGDVLNPIHEIKVSETHWTQKIVFNGTKSDGSKYVVTVEEEIRRPEFEEIT